MRKQGRPSLPSCLLSGTLLVFLLLVETACGITGSTSPPPATNTLINRSQHAIQQVKSYHFQLTTEHPGSSTDDSMLVTKAEGDIVLPDKLQAKADGTVNNTAIQVQILAVGDREYYTDPVTGAWKRTNDLLDPRTLSDPQTGVPAMLGNLQHPGHASASSVDDRTCWYLGGKLSTLYLAAIIGGDTPPTGDVTTNVCIGQSDYLPYQIQVQGVVLQGDTPQTLRLFTLSQFDESVTIQEPKL
ncbi:LppX_LprAFG lipoprotein [Dictyobacter aurantiacus]|uniref:LppX_LprAFG lipoprotein n=1 Tax=Dictyobacter aurantiacus TaxID=1936993 RepID=A0A401ZCM5_9CHLR|nr:LppX_LprAFG lipoprotein [Dictyobacter aurantiacus]GCE04592.1 hypothetical protein KDAU_19210 [Dictyobacter aurantiacus]